MKIFGAHVERVPIFLLTERTGFPNFSAALKPIMRKQRLEEKEVSHVAACI
jgi:hypothetical protein